MYSRDIDIDKIIAPSNLFTNALNNLLDGMTLYKDVRQELYDALMVYVSNERADAAMQYYKYMEELKNGKR